MTDKSAQARVIAFERIRESIRRSGQHVYLVQQHTVPRFLYTIGLSADLGTELLMPGACYFMADEAVAIVNAIADKLRKDPTVKFIALDELGEFALNEVDESWSRKLMLGALDYLQTDRVRALQIIAQGVYATLDTPDCSMPWSATSHPVWRWLGMPWDYRVSDDSTVVTDLGALQGRTIIEAARWEEDQWEAFSERGDQIQSEHVRVVPIGTMFGIDPTLESFMDLNIGDGILRDSVDSEWRTW